MLRDVFYYGNKPNVHPREKFATSLEDARSQCTTEHFWIINEYCDYRNFDWDFDFEFLPDEDVWAEEHNNVWPSQHQKDSGTWLCTSSPSDLIIYRADVEPIKRKNIKNENWVLLDLVDETKFDFSWHPDPTAPPYIYTWGCKFFPVELQACLEYHTPGATTVKYMNSIVELLPQLERWKEIQPVDKTRFDLSWRPSPLDPPMNYVWGNKYIDGTLRSTLEYHMPNATEIKYMPDLLPILPEWDKWIIPENIDKNSFDFTWRPDPREPEFIYQFGTQWQKTGGPKYIVNGATEIKYIDTLKAKRLPNKTNFEILDNNVIDDFDYSWHHDETDEAYVYIFGNTQYPAEVMPTIQYIPENVVRLPSGKPIGRTIKYINDVVAKLGTNKDNWIIPKNIDIIDFDLSWVPNPKDPPYIYEYATQWNDRGGIKYVVPGATEYKYLDIVSKTVKDLTNWIIPDNVDTTDFDFSWVPHPDDPLFIYEFGTQWQKTGGPKYICEGATELKYIDTNIIRATSLPNKEAFTVLDDNVIEGFDFSWHPDATEEPYIYVFGNNQYTAEIMPTIQYIVPGATQIKYINEIIATLGKNKSNWNIVQPVDENKFDFSWVPNPKDPAYIYIWGNKHIDGTLRSTIEYHVPGAEEKKYMTALVDVLPEWDKWDIPYNLDKTSFDFTWRPDPREPEFIYQFGTQWQKTGGPKYISSGIVKSSNDNYLGPVKYIDDILITAVPTKNNWIIPNNINIATFDFSWHPDDTSPPYIYKFSTQWAKSGGPTYVVPGATEIKYIDKLVATALPCKDNWEIPNYLDTDNFDFSWHPDFDDEAFIYQFGTQWQKTGGPKYTTPGSHKNSSIKYIDTDINKVKRLPNKEAFTILDNNVIKEFDFSWHPDTTEEPYIYVFGNNQYPAEIMPTIQYVVPGATEVKYINDVIAVLDNNMTNWVIPDNVDVSAFDFTWIPNPKDPKYIYEFGTQWQKTGGPQYVVPGASEVKYVDTHRVKISPNKNNFNILNNCKIADFDFSWHPDATEEPYIYVFGNNQYPAEIMPTIQYVVPGATEVKYINEIIAILDVNYEHWVTPDNIDMDSFDYSWVPNPMDPAYIYEFGTQWQQTGGPVYVVKGATEIKYVDTQKAKALPYMNYWEVIDDNIITDFDYSWHPNNTDEPYIYVFGNNLYPAEIMPTIQYVPHNAVRLASGAAIGQVKYVNDIIATLDENKKNWIIPDNIDVTDFDFSWVPNPKDPPYIYEFGTQWQKTGGPKYVIQDATDIKYVEGSKAKMLPDKTNWEVSNGLIIADFDYSWHPDNTDEPYIYVFGNNQYPAEIMPTIQYLPHDAVKFPSGKPIGRTIKYIDSIVATLGENKKDWVIPDDVDTTEFDFSWVPDPNDPPYIYEFGTQWQKTGGPKYLTPGIHKNSDIKYVDVLKAKALPNKKNWKTTFELNVVDFDYSWHPDATEEPYIYVFGNSQYPAEIMPTIEYVVEGATQIKYVNDIVAKLGKNKTNWVIPNNIDVTEFDFSWVPNPKDPPYIYEFGTQWQKTGGPKYVVPDADQIKYIDGSKAKALPNKKNWILPPQLDIIEFDYSWHPDATDDPFIYEFGTQWHDRGGPKYVIKNATEVKYITVITARLGKSTQNWEIPDDIDITGFDFSWVPHPDDPLFIYEFGTQWQKTGGPKYVLPNIIKLSTGKYLAPIKYVGLTKAKKLPSKKNWFNVNQSEISNFDFSWHPDQTDPPYIYQFGTLLDKEDGPRYMSPNTNGEVIYLERVEVVDSHNEVSEAFPKYIVTTTLEDLINQHPNEIFWALNSDLDYSEFDFDWRPSIEQSQYVHAFGSSDSETTQTYLVNSAMWEKGFKELNWVVDKKLDDETLFKLFKKSDMFFVDKSNKESQERFEKLKQQFPNIQKTRYLNSWVDTISRCVNRSTTELCWILNSELDYTNFNFEYYPNPWQMNMVHVFGTQWSHWGTTLMVNRETFAQDTKYIKIVEHLSNLNFVKDRKAKATNVIYDIVYIDHGNMDMTPFKQDGKLVIKYQDSYITTFQKMLDMLPVKKEHYIWVASTVCDYTGFDFTYICDPFAREQLHVFPSDKQKFGDTFLINVNKLRELIEDMITLEDYNKINYNQSQRAKRLPPPVIVTEGDTHVESINSTFNFPYAVFVTEDNKDIQLNDVDPMSLWTPESKNIQITSAGGTRIIVPKEAKDYVKRELYDYPYIISNSKLAKSSPMDIIFLSNGEVGADENYQHLLNVTNGLPNRVVRVDGVNGRVAAYHAAAEASTTPWMFTVFAKLKVSNKFDWNWQPDRLQLAKHYVFHARNPVNGLSYGHMAMIAYNKNLTLANQGKGLDFTMDDEHEVLEINSGTANFNTDEWSTWRTAFREALKLRTENSEVSRERLDMWLTVGMGKFNEYSMEGSQHAVEYYEEVNGDFEKLKLSYDWPWLRTKFNKLYNI